MEDAERKYFCKIAGVNTVEAEVSPEESVKILKEAVHLYYDLAHPNLTKIIEEYDYNQFYVVVLNGQMENVYLTIGILKHTKEIQVLKVLKKNLKNYLLVKS